MAGIDSIVGSGSLMPEDLYLRKYEQTDIFESPTLLYDYNRNQLKKEGPVQGFFESDQKRTNYDTNGRLSLRHTGRRSESEPWLPDGTFLDHQFATKDPRSIMYGPDFHKYKEQIYVRGNYTNYRSDEDFSIPEIMIHPEVYRQKIRESQHQAKHRMKIFDTSQIGWHNGGTHFNTITKKSGFLNTVTDQEMASAADFTLKNRSSKTNTLSNDTSIGWRRGVDHRFKVAKYGQIRGSQKITDQDFYKNRGSAKYDQKVDFLVIEDSPVPKPTANMIMDLSAKRLKEINGASGLKLGSSKNTSVRKKKLTQHDMIRAQAKFVDFSQGKTSHTKLDIRQSNNPGKKIKSSDTLQRKTVLKPKIFRQIAQMNRKIANRERDDLREFIKKSSKQSGLFTERTNKTKLNAEKLDPLMGKRNVLYNFKRGEEKKVHVYKSSKKDKTGNDMDMVKWESFKHNSKNNNQRNRNIDSKILQANDTKYDTEMLEFNPHLIGKKGKMKDKSIMRYMNINDHSMHEDSMTEMSSRVRR